MYRNSMEVRLTHEDLLVALERERMTLLPGEWAARSLRQGFKEHQRRRGIAAWQAPTILSWTEWTRGLWTDLVTCGAETRLLLNAAQEHSLWCEIIRAASPGAATLSSVESLARLAQSAWSLAAAWQLNGRLRFAAATEDTRTFAAWADAFQGRCDQEGLLSGSQLASALTGHLSAGTLGPPPALYLVDLPEPTPAQRRLLGELRTRGCELEFVHLAPPRTELTSSLPPGLQNGIASSAPCRQLVEAATEREELRLAVRWVRREVERALSAGRAPRIGILLPETGLGIAELEPILLEVLAPELLAIDADACSKPWQCASGEPLAATSLAATALDLLRLCARAVDLDVVSGLLLSPYLGEASEREANARFDLGRVRGPVRLRPEISLRELALLSVAAARSADPAGTAAPWLAALDDLCQRSLAPKLRRFPSEWMEVLRRLLKTAGWPGDRALSAGAAAALRSWESALDQVATLDFRGERVPFAQAFAALERQVRASSFSASRGGAAVTVLRLDEAAGCTWDALLILRGTDDHWPAPDRLHPLIAPALQREAGTPASRPGHGIEALRRLVASSATVLVTHGKENESGQLRPAPVFAQLGFAEVAGASLLPVCEAEPRLIEELVPDDVPLPPLPFAEVRGGARVLQQQAACGFRAFAEFRLGARELRAAETGLDALQSGNLLHRALELFWRQVGTQARLLALTSEELRTVLSTCIEQAVPPGLQAESGWDAAYLQLQKDRLLRLLSSWMGYEKKRPPFRVMQSERAEQIVVGPLRLKVRLDRVDEVAGGVALVDYKTGASARPDSWLGERPDQPQLPLYSLLYAPGEVRGIAFARLRAGQEMGWCGWEEGSDFLPEASGRSKPKGELQMGLASWRQTLAGLATTFHHGQAELDPKHSLKTCNGCAQRLLCRIDPALLLPDEMADEDDGAEGTHG